MTSKLPKSMQDRMNAYRSPYRNSMVNSNSNQNEKNEEFELKLRPMPEIALIDPVTGKLPKNYKEILAGNNDTLPINSTRKEKNEEFKLKLRPMPEIALIDPVTGKLPKNYKEILAQNKERLPIPDNTRRSKDFQFEVSNLQKNNLSKTGQTYNNAKKGVRKALFSNSRRASNQGKPRLSYNSSKTECAELEESLLLDMEESERHSFIPKQKQRKTHTKVSKRQRTSVAKRTNSLKRSASSSSSSLEKFMKLEQEIKTPGKLNKPKERNIDLSECINNIVIKLNESRDFYQEITNKIETNNIEIRNNLNQILKYLEQDRKECIDSEHLEEINCKKENIPPNTEPNKIMLINNLSITTLPKKIEKKVFFEIDTKKESIDDSSEKRYCAAAVRTAETPRTMFRCVSKKAAEQLLKLQDTPRTTLQPTKRTGINFI